MPDATIPSAGPRQIEPPLGFQQGVVVAWNALDGTNQVRVHGVVFDNLLSLVGSEVGLIRPGDSVGVLRYQNSWAVLGRIEAPGVEQRALDVHTQAVLGPGSDVSTTSSSFVPLAGGPSVSVYIGSSRRCRVDLGAHVSSYAGVAYMGFSVSNASLIAANNSRALGLGGSLPSGFVEVRASVTRTVCLSADDGLNEGLNTFTAMYQFLADDPSGIPEFSDREITVQPF